MPPTTDPRDALLAIGIAAAGAGAQAQQAGAEVLDLLRAMVPYAGSSLSSYDPLSGEHRTLASVGYDEVVQRHLDTWFVDQDAAYQHLRQVDRTPLRWRDFPFPYADMYSARQVFVPAGYRDGMTIDRKSVV